MNFNVNNKNFKEVTSGEKLRFNVEFGESKYDSVEVYVLKLEENSDYVVADSGTKITSSNVVKGVEEANKADKNVIQAKEDSRSKETS